jgi:hypothetical protein
LHHDTTTSSVTPSTAFNLHVSSLFFHVLIEISGEVADTILKGAREFAEDRHRRDGVVRDQIRERDSKGISEAVLAIISDSEMHLVSRREKKELDDQQSLEDIIGLAIKAFACLIRESHQVSHRIALCLTIVLFGSLDQCQFYRHTRYITLALPTAL